MNTPFLFPFPFPFLFTTRFVRRSLGQGAHTCAWVLHFGWTFWLLCIVISALSNKLFLYSSLPFIFAYFFLYLNAVLSFCFWVSTLFSRSKTASIVGVMIYFGGYIITEGVKQSESLTVKLISSIHPVAAFINGINAFVEYEDAAVGITTYTWNSTANKDGYTFQLCLVMLVFDIFFWAFMTWYCENVLPSEWGTHKHALFCVDPRYWLGRWGNRPDGDELLGEFKEGASIENPGAELLDSIKRGEGISIKNLRKSFNTTAGVKHAVDGLDLQMFKNQITCLLGHNGAGKTTTIAMLTGLIDPSSGAAFVDGKDVSTEMSEIRKDLGVCPQHDILYPELTVKEHLRLFGTFKGIPDSELEGAVDEMIKEVGLVEKANTQSKQLSGGMKRKVRVCEERSDELRRSMYGISSRIADTSVRNVAAANFATNSNAMNTSSFATRFACCSYPSASRSLAEVPSFCSTSPPLAWTPTPGASPGMSSGRCGRGVPSSSPPTSWTRPTCSVTA